MSTGSELRRGERDPFFLRLSRAESDAICFALGIDCRDNARLERIARERLQAFGFYLRGVIDAEAAQLPAWCLRGGRSSDGGGC